MKGFILGFVTASILGAGLVWAQMSTWQDNHGNFGTIYTQPPPVQPNWMGPSQQMGQQLHDILESGRRNPC
jgi:hypothetical protein